MSFNHEKEMLREETDPEANDTNNEKFWEKMRLSFEVTFELLYEEAQRLGVDFDNLPEVEIKDPEESPAEILAVGYGNSMFDWINANGDKLSHRAEQLLFINNTEDEVLKFKDALEVIQRYCFFIPPKIHRAYLDFQERVSNEKTDEFDPLSDNLGSAKIALIAVERSITAISVLYSLLPEDEDEMLGFLSSLAKMKKMLLSDFPKAMEFKRPGFDE
jgi:hypothetical protein